jgi:hypothetical protein
MTDWLKTVKIEIQEINKKIEIKKREDMAVRHE